MGVRSLIDRVKQGKTFARTGARKLSDSPSIRFSVVVCSIDPQKFAAVVANYKRLLGDNDCEIIGIHDAKSLAEGYNRGVARARGEFTILSHDDIRILTPDFADRVTGHLEKYDIIGIAGTKQVIGGAWFLAGDPHDFALVVSPHEVSGKYAIFAKGCGTLVVEDIQAMDGVFLAARTAVARKVQFDASTFDNFHLYDLDFTFRAFLGGYRLAVCRDLLIVHDSHGSFDATWEHYGRLFETKFNDRLPQAWTKIEPHFLQVIVDNELLINEEHSRALADPAHLGEIVARLPASRPT